MAYMMYFLLFGLVLGLEVVASNPSPYFAALGSVMVAEVGCGVLLGHGGPFLILFLIYLGGMLVVLAYSAALAAEPYPKSWGSLPILGLVMACVVGVVVAGFLVGGGRNVEIWVVSDELWSDVGGVAMMFSSGVFLLFLGAWVVLLTLFVVLELTRWVSRSALRAV